MGLPGDGVSSHRARGRERGRAPQKGERARNRDAAAAAATWPCPLPCPLACAFSARTGARRREAAPLVFWLWILNVACPILLVPGQNVKLSSVGVS